MSGRVEPRQLAFALPHAESLTRDNFLEGPANAAGVALVDSWPEWPNRTMLLVGPEGSGKSHLAAIWAELAGARSISTHALTASSVPAALATGAIVVEEGLTAWIFTRAKEVKYDWKAYAEKPSGTGPYKFDKAVPHQRMELVPNTAYWDKERVPKQDRLVLIPMPEASTRTAALLSGQVNWI